MSGIHRAISELESLDAQAREYSLPGRLQPGAKVLLTLVFLVLTVSFRPGELSGLLGMGAYPLFMFIVGGVSAKTAWRRLRIVLPVVLLIGIFNPLLDRVPVANLGRFTVTSGMLSMASLVLKAILCVLAAYLLAATTPMEQICFALRRAGLPRGLVTVIMLIYRYLFLLLRETDRLVTAHALRAPGQKGVGFRAWGSLAGNLLLRSVDRAQTLYQSMLLRGFQGEYSVEPRAGGKTPSVVFCALWILLLLILRFVPLGELVGRLVF